MTYIQLSTIYTSLIKFLDLKLPVKKAKKLYDMSALMKNSLVFCEKEERKIIGSYNGVIQQNGALSFDGDDKEDRATRCFADIQELHNTDCELDITPIEITVDEFGNQTISAADIQAVNGIVNVID
jgi:hypothetical protein